MENFPNLANYYLPLLYIALELKEISRFYSKEYKEYRERFQGRRRKKFNAKNIHFDKSKLEKNKRKKLGNLCIEPRQIPGCETPQSMKF